MAATLVLQHLDVLEQVHLRVGSRRAGCAEHALVSEAVEEALGGDVVPAVAIAAHRGDHAALSELGEHRAAGVLATAVAMKDNAGAQLGRQPRHGQSIGDYFGRHPRLDRPADVLAVEQIQHDGQVQPAFTGWDVSEVARAHAEERLGREVARQQVLCHRHRVLGVRRRLEAPLATRADAVLVHEPRAVGALELGVDDVHQCHGPRVCQASSVGLAAALPGAVAADAEGQHLEYLGQGVIAALHVDPGVLHSASLAKYTVAFFRISTCT